MTTHETRLKSWTRRVALIIGAIAVIGGIAFVIKALLDAPKADKKRAQQITIVKLPPPPPPPPPKPPEPPKMKEEVKLPPPVEQPKPAESAEPPPGPLGIDAQGTGAGDNFGLAARPGGRDITLGGSGGGSSQALFANGAARHIALELGRDAKLRGKEFRFDLRVWVARDGRIEKWDLVQGTGNAELDRLIRDSLAQVGPLRQSVPENLPQPLRIRITSTEA